MRILLIHNYYQQPGGEDLVFEDEGHLLETYGHHVDRFTMHNRQITSMGRMALLHTSIWNRHVYREVRKTIRQVQPDLVHFHNTLPLISPSAYYAVHDAGLPIVQTLHNYRLLCPGAYFLRDGHICEDCLGRGFAWPGVVHGCYRQSRTATGAVALMLATHRAMGTWAGTISRYIALTEFVRQKFIQGGLPPDKIVVKPNFVRLDPSPGRGDGGYVLYVGRLSHEKGVHTMLSAWQRLSPDYMLKIVGDGPLSPAVSEAAGKNPRIEWLGQRPPAEVSALMGSAALVLVPSESYETFGRVLIEAFAAGTPVAASRIGAIAEIVEDGRTGRLFRPGDPDDLAAQVAWMRTHPDAVERMRSAARADYEAKYTAARNYEMLLRIYENVFQEPGPRRREKPKYARTRRTAE